MNSNAPILRSWLTRLRVNRYQFTRIQLLTIAAKLANESPDRDSGFKDFISLTMVVDNQVLTLTKGINVFHLQVGW